MSKRKFLIEIVEFGHLWAVLDTMDTFGLFWAVLSCLGNFDTHLDSPELSLLSASVSIVIVNDVVGMKTEGV